MLNVVVLRQKVDLGTIRGILKTGRAMAPSLVSEGMPDPYKHAPLHMGYHAEFDRCWSDSYKRTYGDRLGKQGSSCPDFQGHSIGTNTDLLST